MLNKIVKDILEDERKFRSFEDSIRYVLQTQDHMPQFVIMLMIIDLLTLNFVVVRSNNEDVIQIQKWLVQDYINHVKDNLSIIDYSSIKLNEVRLFSK
jgi:hypothetical protein